ncbi:30S ribosomal protein S4 [Candidatus Adlerbacteria bacterium RIFCSPHIGHO2_01_FULL_54_23]|uniref:Small ribosomal subunit protein uS4 n=3 Tax=Candidatus Adleribacteriota TaxID=1752736 RepID=A0A1F4Y0X2_9BACT|nr:MAG: 30S ribosomal protein S4 [Candidatus Adlerbacteria bacterium GW2011_GWA1_54_10]KKW37975.1 MAG: 30S ribosomal protein S4 [Candidatus Adlerbacteria bacterium GW2011_GWB1_54_7]OGC78583.1 MAG: 30S ribosomal protein S4 [Candidatus Adlerbacteria bacterium RIFCSPHIGHO2_01_FULL_54_23]OGC87592.1 MAG: 30S ribosomal protein S4 [Candidatus Adlerbacteria bacterium RIFCSPLOWO2_01_FULL_54_16]
MLIGPKYKICKRLGASVFEKCQTQKFQLAEARAPRKTRGKRGGSDYGLQLLEKQKARFTYGLTETQFSRYAREAMNAQGKDSVAGLLSRLESRLDNVVYRAGFVSTRRAARQLVSHGHITVNGRRVNIPSYAVRAGDTVAIREGSRGSALFAGRGEAMLEHRTLAWMVLEEGGFAVKIAQEPAVSETETAFNTATIIQFYSR